MKKTLMSTIMGLALGLFSVPLAAPAAAATPGVQAPFGLSWGMSRAEFTHGISCKTNHSLVECRSLSVPKPLGDADHYTLIFDMAQGLVKVRYTSETIEKDPYGYRGKQRFNELKVALTKKYIDARKQELIVMHKRIFIEPDEFYECLNYQGCGEYTWVATPGAGAIALKLNGDYRGKGRVTLEYESDYWMDALKQAEASRAQLELDAL